MAIIDSIRVFFFFLSLKYLPFIKQATTSITTQELLDWHKLCQQFLPQHGLSPYTSFEDLKAKVSQPNFPAKFRERELPDDILGILVTPPRNSKPVIVLNSKSTHSGMHLSTLGHEIGHLMANLFPAIQNANHFPEITTIRARSEDLIEALSDPNEVIADLGACFGIYPKDDFERIFCSHDGQVRSLYLNFSFLLFLRGALYIFLQFPELRKNLISCPHKMFHITLIAHYLRLRVFAREQFGI